MDAIDIRDSAFSLDVPDTNEVINTDYVAKDYMVYIYISAAILIMLVGMFIYKFYKIKKENNPQQNYCEGGFCTMNKNNHSTSNI